MLNFRKIFLLILFCQITVVGYSQLSDYASIYETLKPFQKLTNENFHNERKQLKIKKIIHKINFKDIHYFENLDSIYLRDKNFFNDLILINVINFHYLNQECHFYNNNGLLIAYEWYPISNYLTKQDSVNIQAKITKRLNYLATVSKVVTDKNKTKISISYFNKKDTIIEVKDFLYDIKTKKLKEIYKNNNLKEKYSYSKNKTKIEYYHYDTIDHINKTYIKENVLKDNNIVSSTTYELGFKDAFYIGYLMKYDAHDNIVECVRNEYGNKYPYFTFENKYTHNILSQIISQPDKNNDRTIFSFYENGLLKSEERNGIIQTYEYEYFD